MRRVIPFACLLLLSLLSSAQAPQLSLFLVKQGFNKPLDIKHCNDNRIFVVEQDGRIRIMDKAGNILPTAFLDIDARVRSTGNEQGLLGLAFSPNYKQDGYFYVNYINNNSNTVIARYSVSSTDSNLADVNSEVILLTINQPYSNHNGGNMMFGKDGYLYISSGDGGSGDDPQGYGQNLNTLLGKMLRIDVTGQTTYSVPSTNPFVGQTNTLPEIWAYGLRNPWRCSFDRLTGDLWIGDVGQDYYEEIDFQEAGSAGGENYGWRCREGLHACPTCNTSGCGTTGFVDPVFEVLQSSGSCSITGGYVYRGAQYSKLFGKYLFTDYCSGRFWSIDRTGPTTFVPTQLQTFSTFQYTGLGEDNNGEVYVAYRGSTTTNGRIYRITETTDCKPVAFIGFNDTVAACGQVTLSALAGDTLNYEWYNSSGPISSANAAQYTTTQAGWYKVKVSKQQTGCEAFSDSVYAQVKDSAAISLVADTIQPCVNNMGIDLTTNVSPTGGTFTGLGVNASIFYPFVVGPGVQQVQYSYTNANGCSSATKFAIQVKDTTTLVPPAFFVAACVHDSTALLAGLVQPGGGTLSSAYITADSLFNVAQAGVGTFAVAYNYTAANGCISSVNIGVQVNDTTALSADSNYVVVCANASPLSLTGYVTPAGGNYTGSGVSGNAFDPAGLTDTVALQYTYTNNFGCLSQRNLNLAIAVCSGLNELNSGVYLRVYPNPAKGNATVEVNCARAYTVRLQLTDAAGKVCLNQTVVLNPGRNMLPLPLNGLAQGLYSLSINGEGVNNTHMLVIE